MFNIICTHQFRQRIQTHPKYEMDLGRKYTKRTPSTLDIDIQDLFVLEYYTKNKELLYKVGRLGAINFYTSTFLPDNKIIISKDGVNYEREIDYFEMEVNFERYLAELLMSIQNIE